MVVSEIQEKINEISIRLEEINNLFHIYSINDKDSIELLQEEIQLYKEELKKIFNEELIGAIK